MTADDKLDKVLEATARLDERLKATNDKLDTSHDAFAKAIKEHGENLTSLNLDRARVKGVAATVSAGVSFISMGIGFVIERFIPR